jgi:caffeoyl-CoA O-methyltransferase
MNSELESYIRAHSSPEDPLLAELCRKTWQEMMNPRMVSGHIQGRLLGFISSMIRPNLILEIGTYTGYSAICLAEGLRPGGFIHTIEKDDELVEFARDFFRKAGLENKIIMHAGDALKIIPQLSGTFDLAYIDGEKREYPGYYERVMDKMQRGGFIIVDNVLWNNKVLQTLEAGDKATAAVESFNQKVTADKRVENFLLPFGDGLMMIRVL